MEWGRRRGNLQTWVGTHKFQVSLSLLSAVSGNVTFLVCDASSSRVPGKKLFLLISYKTEIHIAEFPFN